MADTRIMTGANRQNRLTKYVKYGERVEQYRPTHIRCTQKPLSMKKT